MRCDGPAVAAYIDSILGMLDVDDDATFGPLTDGLLILRRLFGFSGSALIAGAVGDGCNQCDAGPIAAYIDSLVE